MERSPELLAAAQILRRTSLRVDHAAVQDLAGRDRNDMLDRVLVPYVDQEPVPELDDTGEVLGWWTTKMTNQRSGIHERMSFFWHTLLPTNRYAGESTLIARQLGTLRTHALGNFRDLLQAFVIDPALMRYLNADASTADKPNENLAREMMELFTIGVGNYSQADVRAAATAIAGYRLDSENNWEVILDPDRVHNGQLNFLGETQDWDLPQIVDRLCDDPLTAARIAAKVWYHFIGSELDGPAADELGAWWAQQDLEIMPLLERVLRDPAMQQQYYARPRSGFEFYAALFSIANLKAEDTWQASQTGQGLYEPPNVAGWPNDRWLSTDSMLRRLHTINGVDISQIDGGLALSSDEILDLCAIYSAEQSTLDAINDPHFGAEFGEDGAANLRWRIAFTCPEFQLT